jgi:hypothetical protein
VYETSWEVYEGVFPKEAKIWIAETNLQVS